MDEQSLSREHVAAAVADAIAESLRRSGREVPAFSEKLRPLKDIAGFDSPLGVEVTVDLEIRFGIELPNNVFIKHVGGQPRARTFREVVDVMVRMLREGGQDGR